MDLGYSLRPLEKGDYFCGYLRLLEQLTIVDSDCITFEEFSNQFDLMEKSGSMVWVYANQNESIIGSATLLIEPKFIHLLSSVGHIEDVVVDGNYRGQNIGRLLTMHLTSIAKEKGCYKVTLNCSDENIGFYSKCNFIKNGNQMSIYFDR